MANASQKRIGQNEKAVKTLRLGTWIPTILSFLLRILFRRNSLPPSKSSLAIYLITFLPALFLAQYLEKIGTVKRDASTGTLISSGEDLNQPGVTEWCFDVLYVTWACQVGSGAFGEWFWWLYSVIPLYAMFKIWTSSMSHYVLGRASAPAPGDGVKEDALSKRQEKLRRRGERGDARVKVQSGTK